MEQNATAPLNAIQVEDGMVEGGQAERPSDVQQVIAHLNRSGEHRMAEGVGPAARHAADFHQVEVEKMAWNTFVRTLYNFFFMIKDDTSRDITAIMKLLSVVAEISLCIRE
jgi:hypothetical protein